MRSQRAARSLALLSIVAVLAACATSTGGSAAPSQVALGTLAATAVPQITAAPPTASPLATSAIAGGSAAPTSIDPCSLLTQDEAATAVGAKVGAGVSTQVGQDRVCTWKVGTTEVKLILAPPAPDAATAQAYWDGQRSQVPQDIKIADITNVSGFDRAAFGSGGVSGYSVSALFVIHGTTFFDFYCGLKACTVGASVTAGTLIVGRLP